MNLTPVGASWPPMLRCWLGYSWGTGQWKAGVAGARVGREGQNCDRGLCPGKPGGPRFPFPGPPLRRPRGLHRAGAGFGQPLDPTNQTRENSRAGAGDKQRSGALGLGLAAFSTSNSLLQAAPHVRGGAEPAQRAEGHPAEPDRVWDLQRCVGRWTYGGGRTGSAGRGAERAGADWLTDWRALGVRNRSEKEVRRAVGRQAHLRKVQGGQLRVSG